MQYSYPASSNPCGKSEIRSEITTDSLKWIELLGSQTRIPAAMVQMALAVGADLHQAAMAQHRMDEAQNLVVAAQNLGAAAQHLAAEVGTTQNLVMAAQNLGGGATPGGVVVRFLGAPFLSLPAIRGVWGTTQQEPPASRSDRAETRDWKRDEAIYGRKLVANGGEKSLRGNFGGRGHVAAAGCGRKAAADGISGTRR
jgi:hypothetical protein